MSRRLLLDVVPTPKPRMTRSDRWRNDPHDPNPKRRQRPPVTRYWLFCDELRAAAARVGFVPPEQGLFIRFWIPMPASWSGKKKAAMVGKPHQQKPDWDNYAKAFYDALLGEDCRVWNTGPVEKRWGAVGMIELVAHEVSQDAVELPRAA